MASATGTSFDDLLHQLLNVRRPKLGKEEKIVALVSKLVVSCGESSGNIQNDKWIRLLLSLLYKRYHLLAPEAKTQGLVSSGETPKKKSSVVVAGDGERLIFYTAAGTLLKQATTTGNFGAVDRTAITKALLVLCQLLPFVGGTRDVCKFIEMFVTHIFTHEEVVNFGVLVARTSDSLTIAKVVDLVEKKLEAPIDWNPYSGLSWLLKFAAKLLDEDLDLVQSSRLNTQYIAHFSPAQQTRSHL
jgi:hypothetical protein